MIPILYNYNEQAFKSNGLGRLTDCLTCEVTEERNGIYECDFTYPVGGALFDELKRGMILGVTHDDTGDIQPFAIVSISRPINGVVSFHAVHISYRLGGATGVLSSIASLTDAVNALQPIAQGLGFFIETLKTSAEPFPMADGVPHTVREFIGGGEGSILDVYGGELEWDKWVVKLHQSRGKVRDFSIRYGVNLADYNETEDWSETYNAVLPYYKKDDTIIVGAVQYVDKSASWTGRTITVPMDVTEYFGDTEPTGSAAVNIIASRIINEKRPDLPLRNITVDFVRLQDFEEFSDIANLYKCSLCDRINVVFPAYKTSGLFQIVKTVWDVLAGRYSSMELGSLQTTLAEALGVGQASGGASGGGVGGVQSVTVTPTLTSGTKIGVITIDGAATDIFAPQGGDTVTWTQTQTSGTKIAEIDIDGTTTDVYAPAGGGGSTYTAESPISISSSNVISHEDSTLGEASTAQGSWSSGYGYYMPYIAADAKGHVTDLQNLGTLIPVNTSSTSGSAKGQTLMPTSWANGLRSMISTGYQLAAGSTSRTITVSTDSSSAYAYRTNFRVVDVQAYDETTFEPVIVDWTTDKLYSASGSITITVSIRSAYSHAIRLFPVLTYATNTM